MKATAGAGFTWIDTAQVELVMQDVPFSGSPDAFASFATPSGVWTKLLSMFVNANTAGALGTNTLKVTAFNNNRPLFVAASASGVGPALNFAITMAVFSSDNGSTDAQMVIAPLPDLWLPPLTLIQMQWVGIDGVGALTNGRATFACARNITF